MKSICSLPFLKTLVFAIAVFAVTSRSAHAQAAEGRFTLAHDAHWGSTALPAGNYSFTISSASYPALLVLQKSNGERIALISAEALSKKNYSKDTELVLTHQGEESFVSSLYVGELGIVLNYRLPESAMNTPDQDKSVAYAMKKVFRLR